MFNVDIQTLYYLSVIFVRNFYNNDENNTLELKRQHAHIIIVLKIKNI